MSITDKTSRYLGKKCNIKQMYTLGMAPRWRARESSPHTPGGAPPIWWRHYTSHVAILRLTGQSMHRDGADIPVYTSMKSLSGSSHFGRLDIHLVGGFHDNRSLHRNWSGYLSANFANKKKPFRDVIWGRIKLSDRKWKLIFNNLWNCCQHASCGDWSTHFLSQIQRRSFVAWRWNKAPGMNHRAAESETTSSWPVFREFVSRCELLAVAKMISKWARISPLPRLPTLLHVSDVSSGLLF